MQLNDDAYIKTTNIKDRLHKVIEHSKTAKFTILTHALNDAKDIDTCHAIYKNAFIRNIVCTNPERALKQEIVAQLQAKIKLDDSIYNEYEPLDKAMNLVDTELQQNKQEIIQKCQELYNNLSIQINNVLNNNADDFNLPEATQIREEFANLQKNYPSITKENLRIACKTKFLSEIYKKKITRNTESICCSSNK